MEAARAACSLNRPACSFYRKGRSVRCYKRTYLCHRPPHQKASALDNATLEPEPQTLPTSGLAPEQHAQQRALGIRNLVLFSRHPLKIISRLFPNPHTTATLRKQQSWPLATP